jgi:hypothetical protein
MRLSIETGVLIITSRQALTYIREPEVKRVEFVSDRMSYIRQRGRCCDIIVRIVHAPAEDKDDGVMHQRSAQFTVVVNLTN